MMKLFKQTLAIAALVGSGAVLASPVYLHGGPSLSTGAVSNPNSLLSGGYNPAASSLIVNKEAPFRMGVLSSLGLGVELGQVDNFLDEIDDLEDDLDEENVTAQSAQDTIDAWDAIREEVGEEGYVKFYVGVQAPLMPIAWYFDDIGTFSLDVSANLEVRATVLDDELRYDAAAEELETNTSLYVKSGALINVGLGFSRELMAWSNVMPGKAHWGVRVNVLQGELSRQVVRIDNDDEDEDIGDVITDAYDENTVSSSSVGLDAGFLWDLPKSRVGIYAKNLIEPELDYGAIGNDCASKTGAAQQNCETELFFADEIGLQEVHTKETQVTVEGTMYLGKDANLSLSAALDLNPVDSPVGDEFQWASVSLSYFPHRFYIPGIRVGYRENQAGSELSAAALGLTLFRRVNLDFLVGLDTIEDDGEEVPRTYAFNLGIEFAL